MSYIKNLDNVININDPSVTRHRYLDLINNGELVDIIYSQHFIPYNPRRTYLLNGLVSEPHALTNIRITLDQFKAIVLQMDKVKMAREIDTLLNSHSYIIIESPESERTLNIYYGLRVGLWDGLPTLQDVIIAESFPGTDEVYRNTAPINFNQPNSDIVQLFDKSFCDLVESRLLSNK